MASAAGIDLSFLEEYSWERPTTVPEPTYRGARKLLEHYRVLDMFLGAGSYGKVCQAIPKDGGTVLAIKQHRYFELDSGFPLQTFKEIQLLKMVNSYETEEINESKKQGQTLFERMIRQTNSVLPILEVCMLENSTYNCEVSSISERFDPMFIACTVHPFYPYDLAGLLYDGIIEKLPLGAVHGLMYQLAYKLMCIHKMNIVHRDIKPANILLREVFVEEDKKPCYFLDAVFCDFGQATILPSDVSIMKLSGFEFMQTTDYALSQELGLLKDGGDVNLPSEEDMSSEEKQVGQMFKEALTSASLAMGIHRVTPICSTLVYRSPEQFVNVPTWVLQGSKWNTATVLTAAHYTAANPNWKEQCCVKGNGMMIANEVPPPSLQNQDVFSLGCVFYELFSFNTSSSLERMEKSRFCRKIPREYIVKPEDQKGPDLITAYVELGGTLSKSTESSPGTHGTPRPQVIEYSPTLQELHTLKQLMFCSIAETIACQAEPSDAIGIPREGFGKQERFGDRRQIVQLPIHPMLLARGMRLGNKPGFSLNDSENPTDPAVEKEMVMERNALRAFASSIHNRLQESSVICSIISFIFNTMCIRYSIEDDVRKALSKRLEKPQSPTSGPSKRDNTQFEEGKERKQPFWHFPITDEQTLRLAYIMDICNILRGYTLVSSMKSLLEADVSGANVEAFTWQIADIAPPADYWLITDVVRSRCSSTDPAKSLPSASAYIPRQTGILRQMLVSNASDRSTIKQVESRLREVFGGHNPLVVPNQLMTEEISKYFDSFCYDSTSPESSTSTSIEKAFPYLTSHESSSRKRCKLRFEAKLREQLRSQTSQTNGEVSPDQTANAPQSNTGSGVSGGQGTSLGYGYAPPGNSFPPPSKKDNWGYSDTQRQMPVNSNAGGANYNQYGRPPQRNDNHHPTHNTAHSGGNNNNNYGAVGGVGAGGGGGGGVGGYQPHDNNFHSQRYGDGPGQLPGTGGGSYDNFMAPQANFGSQRGGFYGKFRRGNGYGRGRSGYYN